MVDTWGYAYEVHKDTIAGLKARLDATAEKLAEAERSVNELLPPKKVWVDRAFEAESRLAAAEAALWEASKCRYLRECEGCNERIAAYFAAPPTQETEGDSDNMGA